LNARGAIAALALGLSSGAMGSCAPVVTQLVVVLRTEVPTGFHRSVEATVLREGAVEPIVVRFVPFPGPTWPLSFGVIAAGPDDRRPLVVVVTLRMQDAVGPVSITQLARVSLRPGKVIQLDMTFERRCAERPLEPPRCVFPMTCRGGLCESIDRDNLPELAP
jgi:hypothetical protein